jgi:hypothetical protein
VLAGFSAIPKNDGFSTCIEKGWINQRCEKDTYLHLFTPFLHPIKKK